MSSQDFIPSDDGNLVNWYSNFAQQCDSYSTILGLTAAEVTAIENNASSFDTAWKTSGAAKQAAKEAVAQKDTVRRNVVSAARALAREFKTNPAVTPAIQAALGITTTTPPIAVTPVTDVIGVGQSNGVNQLSWNRNGNRSGTTFVVEYRIGNAGDWNFAGVTTRSKFSHTGQTPGQEVWYRIISSRAGVNSVPSDPEAVYGGSGSTELRIAA